MARLIIDPVTRVGGNLRIEVEIAGGVVTDAWVSGTMFRGIERVLLGRDPRDAWLVAQRICGTCGTGHALASVRAVENAFGIAIPNNARLIRNILQGSAHVVDEVTGFYQRQALDWVDAASALQADPSAAADLARSIAGTTSATPDALTSTRTRLRQVVDPGQPGPLAHAWWGHQAYRLTAEANLLVMAHYLEALELRRNMGRLQTLLGGKSPHPQSFLLGGMTLAPEWGGPRRAGAGEHPWQVERNAPTALSPDGLAEIASLVAEAADFVDQVYLPDVLMLARGYGEWAAIGKGIGNYLSFGEFPAAAPDAPPAIARGRVMGRDLSSVVAVDASGVAESAAHAHYGRGSAGRLVKPLEEDTVPVYGGPTPPFDSLEGAAKYSWVKAPRYEDDPMEAGALARVLVGYAADAADVRATVDRALQGASIDRPALYSTLGRIVGRAIDARLVVHRLQPWLDELRAGLAAGDLAVADVTMWDPASWPQEAEGHALGETPRGAVGHWLRIRDGRLDRYQVVDASTWNASPRDGRNRHGAIEEALVGTPIADPRRPLEVLRTVHSFDPCLACAVH